MQMSEVIKLYKNIGETPLECILGFKEAHLEYKEIKMTYLGRLDPMAEGLLLVLAGDTQEKDKYLSMRKSYEFEVLWEFGTDTHDILGIIEDGRDSSNTPMSAQALEKKMPNLLNKILDKKTQVYPLFSSKVFSKDFLRVRDANVDNLELPEKDIKIFSIDHIQTRSITSRDVLSEVSEKISKVVGDFRQEDILKSWRNTFIARPNDFFLISEFRADVSSGVYIRGLAHEMGKLLGSSALAWSIKRTRVGDYKI